MPAAKTGINWTTSTWNPVTGCRQVSAGCDHCYALTLAAKLKLTGNPRYQVDGDNARSGPGFGLTLHSDLVDAPRSWRKPRFVFVNSMSDLFQEGVPIEFIADVFRVMAETPHVYQVLTKRPGRMAAIVRKVQPDPLPNVWLGTSVEDQQWADVRLPQLATVPAAIRFLSVEPLLGPVDLELAGIGWVIVGGESGTHLWKSWAERGLAEPAPGRVWAPREDRVPWVRSIRDQCAEAGTAFWLKQWGGAYPDAAGKKLDGVEHLEMPPGAALGDASLF